MSPVTHGVKQQCVPPHPHPRLYSLTFQTFPEVTESFYAAIFLRGNLSNKKGHCEIWDTSSFLSQIPRPEIESASPSPGLPLKTSNELFIGHGRQTSTRSAPLSCTFLLCLPFVSLPSHTLSAQTPFLSFSTCLPLPSSPSHPSLHHC